jgi:hypothetical protein
VLAAAAVLDALVMPCALHEDAPHRERRGSEVAATIPLPVRVVRHAQVRLVHERGGLQRLMRLPLAGEPRPREFAQFVVDFRQQFAGGAGTVVRNRLVSSFRSAQL